MCGVVSRSLNFFHNPAGRPYRPGNLTDIIIEIDDIDEAFDS